MTTLLDPDTHAAQILLDYARARLAEDHAAMKRAAEALHALGLHGGHVPAERLARAALDGVRELEQGTKDDPTIYHVPGVDDL